MKLTDLRNAVNEIDFDRERQEQMILEIQAKKRLRGYTKGLRIAAGFMVCILSVGVMSIPVRALVHSLVQERMEKLPEEEITKIAEQIQSQSAEADSSSREYTKGEKERRGKLYAQYLNGLFPTGELTQVDSEEEAGKYEFCFLTTTSVFYLPANRELTDEEILEQIDFEKKRDYALQEQRAEEIAEKKAAEKEQIKEVVASGGITEEQAVETATGYLQQIFGLDGSGMELNHYYSDPDSAPEHIVGTYCVNWSDMGNYRYYYFFIDAADGTLRSMTYSYDLEGSEAARPAASEAPEKIVDIKEQAESFLREKMEIREDFTEVKSYYLFNTADQKVSRLVDVLFVREDGPAYLIGCRWDGGVTDYSMTTKEEYEEHIRTNAKASAERYEIEEGKEVRIEIIEN